MSFKIKLLFVVGTIGLIAVLANLTSSLIFSPSQQTASVAESVATKKVGDISCLSSVDLMVDAKSSVYFAFGGKSVTSTFVDTATKKLGVDILSLIHI